MSHPMSSVLRRNFIVKKSDDTMVDVGYLLTMVEKPPPLRQYNGWVEKCYCCAHYRRPRLWRRLDVGTSRKGRRRRRGWVRVVVLEKV